MPKIRGLIQVYTGDGKGKTTAALGLAVRAAGAGLRSAIVYFDKGGDFYSERQALDGYLKEAVDIFASGLERYDPAAGTFRAGVTAGDKEEAGRGLTIVRGLFAENRHDLIVLDEVITCVSAGLLDEKDVLEVIGSKPPETELVLTGRGCPASIVGLADLVSEIKDVKHYFRAGVPARKGFDF